MIKELSIRGKYHIDNNGENQDAICYGENVHFSVISLADGVSTCERAKCGAEIASNAMTSLLLKKGDYFFEFEEEQIADFILSHIVYKLEKKAMEEMKDISEYSSTIASVLVDKKNGRLLCFSVGDSMILAVGNGKCRMIATPSDSMQGCCVTTTKNAKAMTSVHIFSTEKLESVVICSDGAWRNMFSKSRLKPEVENMLVNNEYEGLKDFLVLQKSFDDCSFVSLDVSPENRRISA